MLRSDRHIPAEPSRPGRRADRADRCSRALQARLLRQAVPALAILLLAAHPAPAQADPSDPAASATPSTVAVEPHTAAQPRAPRDARPLGPARAVARDGTADPSTSDDASGPARDRSGSRLGIGQVVGALGFVVALILVVFRAIRHGARLKGGLIGAAGPGGRSPSGVLSILARYPLARGQTLILMKLDRRVLLIAQTATSRGSASLSTLCELTNPDEIASLCAKCGDEADRRRFHAELAKFEDDAHPPAMRPSSAEVAGSANSRGPALDHDDEVLRDDVEAADPDPAPSLAVTSLRQRLTTSRHALPEHAA